MAKLRSFSERISSGGRKKATSYQAPSNLDFMFPGYVGGMSNTDARRVITALKQQKSNVRIGGESIHISKAIYARAKKTLQEHLSDPDIRLKVGEKANINNSVLPKKYSRINFFIFPGSMKSVGILIRPPYE